MRVLLLLLLSGEGGGHYCAVSGPSCSVTCTLTLCMAAEPMPGLMGVMLGCTLSTADAFSDGGQASSGKAQDEMKDSLQVVTDAVAPLLRLHICPAQLNSSPET